MHTEINKKTKGICSDEYVFQITEVEHCEYALVDQHSLKALMGVMTLNRSLWMTVHVCSVPKVIIPELFVFAKSHCLWTSCTLHQVDVINYTISH